MKLKHINTPNNFPNAEPGTFISRVQYDNVYDEEHISQRMLKRDNVIGLPDILAVNASRNDVILEMVLEGAKVRTALATFCMGLRGVSDSRRTGSRNGYEPYFAAKPGHLFAPHLLLNVDVVTVAARKEIPAIDKVIDTDSQRINQFLTRGDMGTLEGKLLKFDRNDPEQGVFAVNDATTFRFNSVSINMPSQIVFLVHSDLPAGSYRIQVRTRLNGSDRIEIIEFEELIVAQ